MDNHLMKLKPCPWCKKTPDVSFVMDDRIFTNGTWQWYVYCYNEDCKMKPKSPYVAIRKTTKKSKERLKEKIDKLARIWNDQNDYVAYEGKLINLDEVVNEK